MSSDLAGSPLLKSSRLVRIDVLRGVAILIVILHHSVIDAHRAGALAWLAIPLERVGFSGVDLFFVLSGFLIGGLLFDEIQGTSGLRSGRFYIRRAFKIWPPYFAFLAFALVKQRRHLGSWSASFHDLGPNFLHAQNYLGTSFWHTWSLAVEEHFYLVLPALLSAAYVFGPKAIGPVVGGAVLLAVVGCGAGRFYLNHDLEFRTHLRCDALLVGVFIAYVFHFRRGLFESAVPWRGAWLAAGLALVAPNLVFDVHAAYTRRIGYSLLALGYACILIAVLLSPPGSGPLSRVLHGGAGSVVARIGTYSYCIYLFHGDVLRQPISFHLVPRLAGLPTTAIFVLATSLYIIASVALGAALTWLIEQPSLAVRERFIPRSSRGQRDPAAIAPVARPALLEVNHVLQ